MFKFLNCEKISVSYRFSGILHNPVYSILSLEPGLLCSLCLIAWDWQIYMFNILLQLYIIRLLFD